MANNNFITDPITGQQIDNTGNSNLLTNPVIPRNAILDPITGKVIRSDIKQEGFENSTNTGQFSSFDDFGTLTNLKPNEGLDDAYERRAQSQSTFDKAINGTAKAGVTFVGALAENTLGVPMGVISMLTGGSYQNNIIGQAADAMNEYARENLPNYETKEERESITFGANLLFDKVLNGAAYSAAGMTSMLLTGGLSKSVGVGARELSKYMLKKSAKEVGKNVATAARVGSKVAEYGISGMSGALAESSVEARETKDEVRNNLLADLKARKQQEAIASGTFQFNENGEIKVDINQDEFDEIEKLSNQASNVNFGINMAVVGGTQMLTFANLMRGVSKEGYKNILKQIDTDGAGKFIKKNLTNPQKLAQGASTLAQDAGGEAIQEGLQFSSNIAVNDFYLKKFNNDDSRNFLESMGKGISETVNSKDGLESMLVGALVGGGMTGIKSAAESYQKKKLKKDGKLTDEDKAINRVLEIKNSKTFQDLAAIIGDEQRTMAFQKDMLQAVANKDEAGFNKAYFNVLKSDLYSHLRQGTEQAYLDKLEEIKQFDSNEFKQYFGLSDIQENINPEEFINDTISKTNEAIRIYKNIDFTYETNLKGIEKLAIKLNKDEAQVQEYLKSNLYSALTDYDYMSNREDKLGEELKNESNGLITYLSNKDNGGYIQATSIQAETFLNKENSKAFKEELKKNWKTLKSVRDLFKKSNTKFESVDQFVDKLITEKSKLTKKQQGIVSALESIKKSSLNPIKQKELVNKIIELQQLAIERELNDELIYNLEGLNSGKSNPEFTDRIKKEIDALNERVNNTVVKEAKESEYKENKKNKAKAAATGDPKVEDQVEAIEKEKLDNIQNDAEDIPTNESEEDFTPVISFIKRRYTKTPELLDKEKQSIIDLLIKHNKPELAALLEADANLFLEDIDTIRDNVDLLKDLTNYFESIKDRKPVPKPDEFDNSQPEPQFDPESTTENAIDEKKLKEKGFNVQDNETMLAAPTLEFRIIKDKKGNIKSEYPTIYDSVIGKLNDPLLNPIGTKVLIDYPNNDYNNNNDQPQLFAYILDEKGNRLDIGLISGPNKGTKNKVGVEIFNQITKADIGKSDIDLGLVIFRKTSGKLNVNKGKFVKPTDVTNSPLFAIAMYDGPNLKLETNGKDLDIRIDSKKLKEGYTYMLIETPQKNDKGESIYYAASTTTRKAIDVGEDYVNSVIDLLLKATKVDGKIKSREQINDLVFLNFDIRNNSDNNIIDIYSYSEKDKNAKGNRPLVLTIDKTNPEDLEKLRTFINNAVVKVNLKKLNNPTYNKKISEEGRINLDLDVTTPIYDTQFIIKKEVVKENTSSDTEFDEIPTDEPIKSTSESTTKKKPLPESQVNTQGSLTDLLKKPEAKARLVDSKFRKADEETELNYLDRVIPNTPVQTNVDLNRIASQGSNAWGLFLNGAIYLRKNFDKGTAYHEAFHAIFNSYLSTEERQKLYTDAQIRYGTFNESQKKTLKNLYPNLNDSQLEDIWLEEQLAEDFRRYVEELQDKTLPQKIKDFFKKLWNMITFVNENKGYINEVFRNIDKGVYGKRPINYRFTNIPLLSHRIEGFNNYESREAVDFIHNIFNGFVKKHMKDNGTTEIESLNALNPNKYLYHAIYDMLKTHYETLEEGSESDNIYNILVNYYSEDGKLGNLVKNHKLYYKVYNNIEINDNELNINTDQSIEEILEELDEIPDFLLAATEKNGKQTISQELKKVIFNLETDQVNIFGFNKLANFDSLYNTLEAKLSGVTTSEELKERLQEQSVFHSELNQLVNELDNNKDLMAQMFHHFAKGQNVYQQLLSEKVENKQNKTSKTKVSIINASAKKIKSEILTNLETDLVSSDVFNSDGTVNKTNAEKYYKIFKSQLNVLKQKDNLKSDDFTAMSNLLINKFSIPLTSDELLKNFKSLEGTTKIEGVLEALSKGINPFVNPSVPLAKALTTLSEAIRNSRKDYHQASIINGDGKQQFSYTVPAFIHKLTNYFNHKDSTIFVNNLYGKDKSYNNSLILGQVRNKQKIEVVTVDSVQLSNETNGTRFNSYNSIKYDVAAINSYINQEDGSNNKSNKALYQFPITSNAPINYYMRNDKLTISEAVDNLYNIYTYERDRMETSNTITNYNADEFIILPFFNEIKDAKNLSRTEVTRIIEENMNTYFDNFYSKLLDVGTLVENKDGSITSDYIDGFSLGIERFSDLKDVVKEYYFASTFMLAEITTVYAGDPSFAKMDSDGSKVTDLNKRLREISSPAAMLDTSNMSKSTYEMLIVADEERDIVQGEFFKAAKKLFNKSDSERIDTLAKAVDNTDGQSIITMERYKDIKKGQGLWTSAMQSSFVKIKEGNGTYEDSQTFFSPIKGFHFELTVNASGKVVPIQKKDSEIVLLPMMVENNPKLKKLWDRMYDKDNPVDIISFGSAVKKGKQNINTLDNLNMHPAVTLPYSGYGIQQPTDQKHLDYEINFGTQFRKIIIGHLDMAGNYKLNGTNKTGLNIKSIYETFIIDNLTEDSQRVIEEMGYREDGTIDYIKLQKLLVKELDNGDYGPEFKEHLEIVSKDNFKIPLWSPIHAHRIESLLNSIVKNNVSKQKIKGATFVNATSYLVENDNNLEVKMGVTENGKPYVEHFEVMLPEWSKDIATLYINKNGSIKDTMPKELRELVGYRIPTEAKYSMTKVFVKGFTPQSLGSVIFAPTELIKTTGLDFDIDKMFFMIPEHRVVNDPNGKLKELRYIKPNYDDLSMNDKKQRNNGIIEIAKSVLSAPQTFNEQSNPGSFENWSKYKKSIKKAKSKNSKLASFALPDVQKELFEKNRDAGALIGVFANNVASNNMLSYENLGLNIEFNFAGQKLTNLDGKSKSTTRSLSTLVAAAVDAVKDPIFFDLNIGKFTGNILATMIRLGVNEYDAVMLLNNDKIIEVAKQVSKLKYETPSEISRIIGELKKDKTTSLIKSNDDLKRAMTDSNDELDTMALNSFEKFYEISRDVHTLTIGTKLDASPPGTIMADNEIKFRKVAKIKEGLAHFPNSSVIFSSESNYPLINAFYKKTYNEPTEKVFKKVLPWYNQPLVDAKDMIADLIGQDLTSKQINDINNALITYFASTENNMLISREKRAELNGKFWNDISKFRRANPNKYLILDMLDFNTKDKVITFRNNTALSSYKLTELKDSWYDLYLEDKNLATDLFKYNFAINGFNYNSKSFTHLAPEVMFTDVFSTQEFEDKNLLTEGSILPFVRQYIENNYKTLSIPQLDEKGQGVNRESVVVNQEKQIIYFIGDKMLPGTTFEIIKDDEGKNKKEFFYPEYIKSSNNDVLWLRRGGPNDNTGNGKEYFAIPGKGSKFAKEYKYDDFLLRTSIDANKITSSKTNDKGQNIILANSNVESYYDFITENSMFNDNSLNKDINNQEKFIDVETGEISKDKNDLKYIKEIDPLDRFEVIYPKIIKIGNFEFNSNKLQNLILQLNENKSTLDIKDQRVFKNKNSFLTEYGMSEETYKIALENEELLINIHNAAIENNLNGYLISDNIQLILDTQKKIKDTFQTDLFKGVVNSPELMLKNYIQSTISKIQSDEALTDQQKEYYTKLLTDNPTHEGYKKYKESLCK